MNVLAMDFGALPPEINSAKMYFGPGSGPMLAAAVAWEGLAAQLHSTAASYSSVISELEGSWTGPSAASMAAAAAPYAAWLTGTATQAEQTAALAKAAAGAYAAAFAMTVPPPVIAANRSLLAALVATNFLGQNTPAIAVTETHYGEMWAQDAAAMYSYAASSASASTLTPFTAPAHNTNPAGQAAQGAAVAQARGTSAATNAQSMISAITTALRGLASPGAAADPPSLTSLGDFFDFGLLDLSSVTNSSISGLGGGAASAALSGGVSAGMGRATLVGALSAPQSWAAAAPATRSIATSLPGSGFGAAAESGPAGTPGIPGMPMAATAGQGTRFPGPRYGVHLTVMPRPIAVG